MKITGVETQVWRSSYRGEVWPAWSPGTSSQHRQTTVFLIHTDEGLTGLGAGVGDPGFVSRQIAPRLGPVRKGYPGSQRIVMTITQAARNDAARLS